ncbi:MAG: TolC family protein [Gallionella sp.]
MYSQIDRLCKQTAIPVVGRKMLPAAKLISRSIFALLCLCAVLVPRISIAEASATTLSEQQLKQRDTQATTPVLLTTEILLLDDAVALAVSDNRGLAAMKARARALSKVPSQVGTLPDPTLTLGLLNVPVDSYSMSQEAMTKQQLVIGFTLPFPGKLGLREQVAELEAGTAEQDVAERRLKLVSSVRSHWWNLFYLDKALSLVQRNRALLREFTRIAESKYKVGQGMQSDVLLAQVELSKLLELKITLQASRRGQAAMLNVLLGRVGSSAVLLPEKVDEVLPQIADSAELIELANESRPRLIARRKILEAARARTQLAEKDYYPDMRMGAAYGFRSGNNLNGSGRADLASITFNVKLPIFSGSRQDKAVDQRQAEALKEEYDLQDALLQVTAEIEKGVAEYQAAREQASLFKSGIIPQAGQTASAMLAAYQVNKVDFLNLVRAQVTLYNYETQYWKAISSGWQAWARLEAFVGKPIATSKPDTDKENMQ